MTRALITLKIDQVISGLVVSDFGNTSFFRLRLTKEKKNKYGNQVSRPLAWWHFLHYLWVYCFNLIWRRAYTIFFFSEKQVNIYVKNLMICTFWLSVEMLQKLILCEVGCAFLLSSRNQKFHLFSRLSFFITSSVSFEWIRREIFQISSEIFFFLQCKSAD